MRISVAFLYFYKDRGLRAGIKGVDILENEVEVAGGRSVQYWRNAL